MNRYKVPLYAKKAAQTALNWNARQPKSKRVGTASGLARARQLIRNDYIDRSTAVKIAAFYARFKGCNTERCNQALNLWGGRKYGLMLSRKLNKKY